MLSCDSLVLFFLVSLVNFYTSNTFPTDNYDLTQVEPIESAAIGKSAHYHNDLVKPIDLAAVGRVAHLGELYDARSDQFLHLSLIKSNLPSKAFDSTQNRETKLKYTVINTLEEKFKTLDISAELKLSIMGGLFNLEGSGKYFQDKKRSAKSAKASLISSFNTEYQQMSITGSEVRDLIDLDVLEQIDATHVVVGIQWGGNVFISVEDTNVDDQDQQQIEGKLSAELNKLSVKISGSAEVKFDEKERNELSKFKFEIYGDILPADLPQNIIEALLFMKTAPKLLLDGNEGKGKAMKYNLIPIKLVRQIYKISSSFNTILNKVDEAIVNQCTRLFDDINIGEQKFNDLLDELKRYEKYIETNRIKELKDLHRNYKIYHAEVQGNLSTHLVLARSGSETMDELRSVIAQSYNHPYSLDKINFDNFTQMEREFKFFKLLLGLNTTILDKMTSFQDYMSTNLNKDIFAVFYKEDFPNLNDETLTTFRNMLEQKDKYGPNATFIAVKDEILDQKEKDIYFNYTGANKLSMFRNGRRIIENYRMDSKIPPNEKVESWSFPYMQTYLFNLVEKNDVRDEFIKKLTLAPVPIGSIYVQLAHQQEPKILWPNTEWENISSKYAGMFFRAENGTADCFGKIQEQQTESLQLYSATAGSLQNNYYDTWVTMGPKHDEKFLITGMDAGPNVGIRFRHGKEEIRPRNQAIRIWRREK